MMTVLVFALALPWLLIGVGCWLGYHLVRQHGRILLRLEGIEKGFAGTPVELPTPTSTAPRGLPLASMAPDFELPDLAGTLHRLSEFRGRRVLLMFFNPGCGFCAGMMPELAALATEGQKGHLVPLVISTGDPEANRQLFQTQGIDCLVLLQKDMEVAAQYKAPGTPVGYLLNEKGELASELTIGAAALVALATASASQGTTDTHHGEPSRLAARGNKALDQSRLKRSGLKAGTPAPNFRLPRLDGRELALEDFGGKRVLLVFTDPACGPCELLAPKLERVHRERSDLQVLMISRQDAEINRQKVAKLGLTFPVMLQRNWEVSLQYAIFATPVGYLIDERGVLDSDVAEGSEAILALASRPSLSPNGYQLQPEGALSLHV
jgi:peroxiredoxin